MSADKPTLRELWQLKQDYRNAPEESREQQETWQQYQEADALAGFVKGLVVYLAD